MIAAVDVFGWNELAERIRSGDVATDLIRPVHPLRAGLAFDYGRALYHTLFRGLPPMVVGAIVFDLTAPSDPVVWAVFLVSVVLAISVAYAFHFLYNLVAFWLLDYRGVMRISVAVLAFFSGLYIPDPLLPRLASDARVHDAVPEHGPAADRRVRRLHDGRRARRNARDAAGLGGRALLCLLRRVPAGNAKAGRAGWLSP